MQSPSLTALTVLALGLTAGPAAADRGKISDFSLGLSSRVPATASGMDVSVVFHTAGDPDVKSSPIRSVVIAGPSGLKIESAALPQCGASDAELHALGTNACPADTQAGLGTYSAILGVGAPVDPFVGDNHVFNANGQLIEVITLPDSSVSPGFDRLTIKDGTLTAHPPVTPGGPPDGETATRSIQFTIPVHASAAGAFITTPSTCPATGYWESTGTFGFASGQTETIVSRTPCDATATGHTNSTSTSRPCLKTGRLTLRIPRDRRAGVNKRVSLYIDHRLARRLRASARRVRVDLRTRRAGRHLVCVRVLTAGGRRLSRHRVIRLCG